MDGYDYIWIHVMTLLLLLLTLFRKFEAWFLDFTGQMYYLLLMFQSHTGQFSQMRGHRSQIKPKTQTNVVLPNTSKSNTHTRSRSIIKSINQSNDSLYAAPWWHWIISHINHPFAPRPRPLPHNYVLSRNFLVTFHTEALQ